MPPYRDPIVAARARSAQLADDFSFEVEAPDTEAPMQPRRPRIILPIVLASLAAAATVALVEWDRSPAAAAAPRLDATFVMEVVSRTGELNAFPRDRCIVDLHLAREGECRVDVVCPGIEKHSTTPACTVPAMGAVVEAHWTGVDFDGELLSFDVADESGTSRGQLTARVDAWRR